MHAAFKQKQEAQPSTSPQAGADLSRIENSVMKQGTAGKSAEEGVRKWKGRSGGWQALRK